MIFKLKASLVDSFGYDDFVISLGRYCEEDDSYEYADSIIYNGENPYLMIMIANYLNNYSREWRNNQFDYTESDHCECCGGYTEERWEWYFPQKGVTIGASVDNHHGGSYGFYEDEIRREFEKIGVRIEFDGSMKEYC
ncbi:MAG: hypothetical protein ACRCZ0_09360, partial [Cetobacterium sp.]